jgi:hypothetical protein
MNVQSINVLLPTELLTQLQQLGSNTPEALNQFVIQAIEHELQRHQTISRSQGFSHNVEGIRAQMNIEGISIEPDEIWGDVRDRSPGREVVL